MTAPLTEALASPPVTTKRPSLVGLIREGFADLLGRYRLISYLVGADLKRTHADTLLGQLWWVFDPLLQMAVYFVLVEIIFQRKTPDFPLFLFAAILPWKWFTTTLNDATLSVTGRQSLIRQLQFPKLVLPTAAVAAGTASFLFGLIALGLVYLFYLERLSPWVVAIPVIAAVQFVFTLALAIALSAFNAFYRDVQNVLRHALRLWFYLSPVLYSLDKSVLGEHKIIMAVLSLNPFAVLLTSYRDVTWGTTSPDWQGLLNVLIGSLVLLTASIALFKRVEPAFARIL
jgi:lipopolysaccharide transport system permease protein/teichoic acid transport system permease protein